jgi:hypothetical protein
MFDEKTGVQKSCETVPLMLFSNSNLRDLKGNVFRDNNNFIRNLSGLFPNTLPSYLCNTHIELFRIPVRECAQPYVWGRHLGKRGAGSPRREQGASVEPR